jgi:hypothetical protein
MWEAISGVLPQECRGANVMDLKITSNKTEFKQNFNQTMLVIRRCSSMVANSK